MSTTPLSPTRLFTCTACGAVLPVGEELVGKPCRCGRCGQVNVVGEETPRRKKKKNDVDPGEKFVGFSCRVCDTRLSARAKHVGRKAVCPDCGAKTEVPPPPKPRPKQKPRAMHGQQYGLWGVDEAPLPSELAAQQPKFFPVWCRVCDTLMHARENQIGKKLTCPDCGAKTKVDTPPEEKARPSVLVPDGDEYQLDASDRPPARPKPQRVSTTETAQPSVEPIRTERQDRPSLPRLPLLQSVPRMLMSMTIVGWSLWLTAGLTVESYLVSLAIAPIAGVAGALMVVASIAMSFLVGAVMLSSAAAIWLSILIESSEGNDRLQQPPGWNFVEWFGDAVYLLIAVPVSVAPWWLLASYVPSAYLPVDSEWILAVGYLLTFPLILLSCLANGSPLEPFSPRLFGTLWRRPGAWLLFHAQTVAFGVAGLSLINALVAKSLWWTLLIPPLAAAASMLYFRVLGRLAWWLAETDPAAEPSVD